jgi:tubulin--tyrosine ligase
VSFALWRPIFVDDHLISLVMVDALVDWPSAPLTDRLVTRALSLLHPAPNITSSLQSKHTGKLVQWSAYDSIDHEATHAHPDSALASSFTIRKALIRKHFLARCVQNYAVKHPSTALARGVPRTWDVELAFADELDEKWADELWDLGAELENGDKWWILKPGMADRGMGIRLFNSKEMLEEIFQEFEEDETDDEDQSKDDTAIVVSQLRHFVIQVFAHHRHMNLLLNMRQDYISDPLLLDPRQVPIDGSAPPQALRGHKVSPAPVLHA